MLAAETPQEVNIQGGAIDSDAAVRLSSETRRIMGALRAKFAGGSRSAMVRKNSISADDRVA
jgi:hypothetical protein